MTRSERLKNAITLMQDAVNRDLLGERKDAIAEVNQEILSLLLAEQKRSEGCAFCNMEIDDEHGFFMEQNYLFYREGKCGTEGIQVAFCPACGRDLTEGESV